ncbi:hypothetical protein CIHG_04543 [Coccidioides immitis H538.4]|uniref:Uncharacterized protein n=1 Tax=Coccidioides immitis H538.4 TaxID=396776 RepID=A0A0J8RS29_COCIT|nr:hypothetical protein CIHG_04543 [Coccidioides immitis H538.4]
MHRRGLSQIFPKAPASCYTPRREWENCFFRNDALVHNFDFRCLLHRGCPPHSMPPSIPWYIPPAIIAAGAFPMLFVSYTAAPFVNLVYLALPAFAQQSREHMLSYLQNVPRTATLSIETMKFNFYPRRTQVAISDLAPGKSLTRPVSFINTNPQPQPWWRGKDGVHFYTPEANRPAKSTPKFFPEAWERVFAQIKQNSLLMKNK